MHHDAPYSHDHWKKWRLRRFDIVRDLKSFTSRHTRKAIESNGEESKKEWVMREAGLTNNHNKEFQFWFQHNHPVELSTNEMLIQRLNYIDNNPVIASFVDEPAVWLHSSARNYAGEGNGRVELIFIE